MISKFKKAFIIDTEYRHEPGSLVAPVALTAKEILSGQIYQYILTDWGYGKPCPLPTDSDVLYITFFAPAEASTWHALGWENPLYVIDLYVEQKNADNTNLKNKQIKNSLLAVSLRRGLNVMDALHKDQMRDLIIKNEEYTPDQKMQILDYNLEDVIMTENLLNDMVLLLQMDWNRAMIRGKFSWLSGRIEGHGIPLDTKTFKKLQRNWDNIERKLIYVVDKNYGFYDGKTFKVLKFLSYLRDKEIPWIFNENGVPKLDDETFKEMILRYPELTPIRELRKTLGQMRLKDFPIGTDGRTRTNLNPFASMTGRNQPSNSKYIFGSAKWLRSTIQPEKGMAIAIVDQSQQEFGIAAALSNDEAMKEAYQSGDPYLAFAKSAGAVPLDATKKTHAKERELYKQCTIAVQYGMGSKKLSERIGRPEIYAKILLDQHKSTYKKFWSWQEQVLNFASIKGYLHTTFGWGVSISPQYNHRSMANYLMQANGAEILRIATILADAAGLKINALIHDAIMIESSSQKIETDTELLQQIFTEAGQIVLNGFPLKSDAQIIKYPGRYMDEKGQSMWEQITEILKDFPDDGVT